MPFTPLGIIAPAAVVNASTSTVTLTTSQTVPAGTLLVVGVEGNVTGGLASTPTVTDTGSNTWRVDAGPVLNGTSGQASQCSCVTAAVLASGATITVTLNNPMARAGAWCDGFAGVQQGGPYWDAATAVSGAAVTATAMTTAASASPTVAPDVLAYATWGIVGARTFTAGTGWTATQSVVSTAGTVERQGDGEYIFLTAPQTVTGTATQSATGAYAGVVATYKAAVALRPRIVSQAVNRAASF